MIRVVILTIMVAVLVVGLIWGLSRLFGHRLASSRYHGLTREQRRRLREHELNMKIRQAGMPVIDDNFEAQPPLPNRKIEGRDDR